MPLTESQKSQLRKMSADEALEAAYRLGLEVARNACLSSVRDANVKTWDGGYDAGCRDCARLIGALMEQGNAQA